MLIDWSTITAGNVLTTTVTLIGFYIATRQIKSRIEDKRVQDRMKIDMLWRAYCKEHDINGDKL